LGHLDFNPGNILCSADQCIFLDWAEACVGPPFLTLEYLREHLERLRRERTNLSADVVKPFETTWRRIISAETIFPALALAPVLAVFAYAAGTKAWRDPAKLMKPKFAGYLRGLTRRMNGEMQRLQDRRRVCSN
jgi:Ser/Thr protein kinase RdoA (MazF antagonist)